MEASKRAGRDLFDAFYKGIGLERHRKVGSERNSMLLCLFGLFDGFCDGRDVGEVEERRMVGQVGRVGKPGASLELCEKFYPWHHIESVL